MKHYVDILLEDISDKFKYLNEGQSALLEVVQENKVKLTTLESDMKYMNIRLKSLEKTTSEVKQDTKDMKRLVKEYDQRTNGLNKRINQLEIA